MRWLALLLTSMFLVGCAARVIDSREQTASALEERMQRYLDAWTQGDVSALGGFFTEDATLSIPNMPEIRGRERIEALFRQAVTAESVLSISNTTDEIRTFEGGAYSVGSYEERLRARNGTERHDRGRYIILWSKGPDGNWRMRRFMAHSIVPPALE